MDTFTVRQAALAIGCSGAKVYDLMNKGELTFRQVGRRRLPLVQSVADYMAANERRLEPIEKQQRGDYQKQCPELFS